MADESHAAIPLALDTIVSRLDELETVFGPQARSTLAAVRQSLIEAMAARDRGNDDASVAAIGRGMDRLAALADQLDPEEAVLMRAIAGQFRAALMRRDTAEARTRADVMFQRSGARWTKKK